MHPNRVFHDRTEAANLAFARERGFGVLAVGGKGNEPPMLSHVPFVLSRDGSRADLHLMRSNPIARACAAPLAARLAVSGPDGYISPDWYGTEDQVPTWNYVAVHLAGTLEPLDDSMLRGVLERLSAQYEDRLLPKPPWLADKVSPDHLQRLMRMIAPFRLVVEAVEGTWKLSQNKPDEVRRAAADHVENGTVGAQTGTLARLMRDA